MDAQTSLNIHICTGQVYTIQNTSFALKAKSCSNVPSRTAQQRSLMVAVAHRSCKRPILSLRPKTRSILVLPGSSKTQIEKVLKRHTANLKGHFNN